MKYRNYTKKPMTKKEFEKAVKESKEQVHKKIPYGQCDVCGHCGDDCTGIPQLRHHSGPNGCRKSCPACKAELKKDAFQSGNEPLTDKEMKKYTDSHKQATHTPTPWIITDGADDYTAIENTKGEAIADYLMGRDADFIVKAVNNFEEGHVSNKNAETQIKLYREGKITAEKALQRIGSLVGPYLAKAEDR